MDEKKLPSVAKLQEMIESLSHLNDASKELGFESLINVDSDNLTDLSKSVSEMVDYPKQFNEVFRGTGWVAHGLMEFELIKSAVDFAKEDEKSKAEELLIDYYSAEQIESRMFFLTRVDEIRKRRKYLDFAIKDSKDGRYYSAIPLLLMLIDGAANDAFGNGLHSERTETDVWDSILSSEDSLMEIKNIFQKGRYKTHEEKIDLPFRNGILHGMDLGYDNEVVLSKCWCFLFVVADWIESKKSESARKQKFEEFWRGEKLSVTLDRMKETERQKSILNQYEKRDIDSSYLNQLVESQSAPEKTPEGTVFDFVDLWKKKNFGKMAKLYWNNTIKYHNRHIYEVKEQTSICIPENVSCLKIEDVSPCRTDVILNIKSSDEDTEWKFQMIKEDEEGNNLCFNDEFGAWKIMMLYQMKSKD